MEVLVTSWASTPTCRRSYDCGGSSQRLVIAAGLLLLALVVVVVVVVVVAALRNGTCIWLAILAYLWGKWGVSGTALCSPSALVRQA
jgi:hypothetical protein